MFKKVEHVQPFSHVWEINNVTVVLYPGFSTRRRNREEAQVYFEDSNNAQGHRLIYDGVPFIIVRRRVYDCQHGVDRHAADKKKFNASRKVFLYFPPCTKNRNKSKSSNTHNSYHLLTSRKHCFTGWRSRLVWKRAANSLSKHKEVRLSSKDYHERNQTLS